MKEKIFNLVIIIISLFVLGELFLNKSIISSAIMLALNLWVNNLVPALFPFFIISDILINYNIIDYIPKNIKDICKRLFNIDDNQLTIFFLSMLSGFPSNARNTRILYDNDLIDEEGANHILLFTHFANPLFILATIGAFFLGNKQVGLILLLSHYLSNVIIGIILRGASNNLHNVATQNAKVNFANVWVLAIKRAVDTTLLICGIVTIFLVLATITVNLFNFSVYNAMLIKGIFEITIGIEALSKVAISLRYKAIIASCFLAFGGLSVHIQVLSQIIDTKIKYSYFLIGRIYQVLISGILTYLLCIIYQI